MRHKWFQSQDNIVYVDVEEYASNFGKEAGIEGFREKLGDFRENPTKDGVWVKGKKRTTLRLFIPNLYFVEEEKLEMGDMVWVYIGEHYPCYCIYWPLEEE